MIRKMCIFFILVSMNAVFVEAVHRYHTSLTRIDYNANERTAEITIQIFTNDLEDALTRQGSGKQPVHLDKTPKVDELILNYFENRFVIKNKTGEIKKFRSIGLEPQNDITLIYLEASMPEGFDGATLENSILNDLFSDEVNLVTVRANGVKTDLVFKTNEAPQSLIRKNS